MKRVRTRDTGPELAVRRLLHAAGWRYRVQYRPNDVDIGRSTVDIAFPGFKVAVFIDGCFWHGCPEHGTIPKTNTEWWTEKLSANMERDKKVTDLIEKGGWTVMRFWSHEPPNEVLEIIGKRLSAK